MFLLPLRELAGSGDPQSNSLLVGPELVGSTAPAISDRETVSYSPSNPSLELPFDD